MVCLDYVQEKDVFVFSGPSDALKIQGVSLRRDIPSSPWALPAWYPAGLVALQGFKKVFPAGKATPDALKKIAELKSVQDQIKNAAIMNSCGFKFKSEPYIHQVQLIEAMLWYKRLAVLAEMGTGKTFTALNYVAVQKFRAKKRFPTIVLAPLITLRGWEKQVKLFTDLTVVLYRGQTKKQLTRLREGVYENPPDILLTNYEALAAKSARELRETFRDYKAEAIIMDEGSRLKGHDTTRSVQTMELASGIEHRYILSGTLCLGNPEDVYNPFSILYPPIFGKDIWAFRKKYIEYSKYNKHIVTGYRHLDDMKQKIDPFFVSLKRSDCLDLPDRVFSDAYYELSPTQEKLYEEVLSKDVVYIGDRAVDVSLQVVKITKLMQICSGFFYLPIERNYEECQECRNLIPCVKEDIFPFNKECYKYDHKNPVKRPAKEFELLGDNGKLAAMEECLRELNEKVIVFAVYKPELDALKAVAKKLKRPVVVSTEDYCEDKFLNAPDNAIFLGQVSTCIGITLNSATKTLYYSLPLNLEHYQQSLDRNLRIGQKNEVTVTRLLADGKIDGAICRLLEAKEEVQDFVQSKPECVLCANFVVCIENGVEKYSDACVLSAKRTKAEAKCRLRVA